MADHPAEELRRDAERGDLSPEPRGPAQVLGRLGGERAADRGADEERADHVRAATLVLLLAAFAVLVAADRDVLGTVVGGDVGAAQRERGGSERKRAGEE